MSLRGDGSIKARKKCLEPVITNLGELEYIITKILEIKGLSAKHIYVMQSRAMGTCKPDSDIDIYVQLMPKHADFIEENGVLLYEGKQEDQFTGNWHPITLKDSRCPLCLDEYAKYGNFEENDPHSLKHYWPYKVLHDTHAPHFYREEPSVPEDLITRLDELQAHFNFGVHPFPPRKVEYGEADYFISFAEIKWLARTGRFLHRGGNKL